MILGESAGVAAAMAVSGKTPVQDVPYDTLKGKLLKLGQKLERPPPRAGKKRQWASQKDWDKHKAGYEWVFPVIDQNADGKVTSREYDAFQAFKKTHANWAKALRRKRHMMDRQSLELPATPIRRGNLWRHDRRTGTSGVCYATLRVVHTWASVNHM